MDVQLGVDVAHVAFSGAVGYDELLLDAAQKLVAVCELGMAVLSYARRNRESRRGAVISTVYGNVGSPVRFEGTAYDFGHAISAIEFSMDDGKSWTVYDTPETNDYQNLTWVFDYTPVASGRYVLKVRAVNDCGKASPESAYAELIVE